MRFPVVSRLPGLNCTLSKVQIQNGMIVQAEFIDRVGDVTTFRHSLTRSSNGFHRLLITDSLSSPTAAVNFCPWPGDEKEILPNPPPFPKIWSASGLFVDYGKQRRGLATAMYAYARIFLSGFGVEIAPSDNLLADGEMLWKKLDPSIQWEASDKPLAKRPNLTGKQPPTR